MPLLPTRKDGLPLRLLMALPETDPIGRAEAHGVPGAMAAPHLLWVLASLVPAEVATVTLVDGRVTEIPRGGAFDAVLLALETSGAVEGYAIADVYRQQGATVILGGAHVDRCPDEARQHADVLLLDSHQALIPWRAFLADLATGELAETYDAHSIAEPDADRLALVPPRRELLTSSGYNIAHTTYFMEPMTGSPRTIGAVANDLGKGRLGLITVMDDDVASYPRGGAPLFEYFRARKVRWVGKASAGIARDAVLLQTLAASGCEALTIELETPTDADAKARATEALENIHAAGLNVHALFRFGGDGETSAIFTETVDLAVRSRVLAASFRALVPWPGTPWHTEMRDTERLLTTDWRKYDGRHAVFRPTRMAPEALENGLAFAYRAFYSWNATVRRVGFAHRGFLDDLVFNLVKRHRSRHRSRYRRTQRAMRVPASGETRFIPRQADFERADDPEVPIEVFKSGSEGSPPPP